MPDNFLVIRIHLYSPVDGATLACTWSASRLRYAGRPCGPSGSL